jgi:hypothetical protein
VVSGCRAGTTTPAQVTRSPTTPDWPRRRSGDKVLIEPFPSSTFTWETIMANKNVVRGLAAVLVLALATPAWAQQPKEIIEKAIKAHGGADNLAKLKSVTSKGNGNIYIMGMGFPFKVAIHMHLPDKARTEVKLDLGGKEVDILEVINGDKGWESVEGMTKAIEGKDLELARDGLYASYLSMLTPMLKDKEIELKALGESKVDGKVALGIKVSAKGHSDMEFYFDKASGLLVKLVRPGQDPVSKNAVKQEEVYSDYKAVEGVQQPFRMVVNHDGQKFMEFDVASYTFMPSFDAKMFAQPK